MIQTILKNPIAHGVASGLIMIIPFFILNEPSVANLTIGAILTAIASAISKYLD